MRAVVITKHGGPEVLQVQERPDAPLGPGEVRIEVAAAGINFADVMARMGLYRDAPKTPCVVGYEVAGTILELGEGVEGLQPGQRVIAGTQFGGYASQVVVPAGDVVPLPEQLSFEQGAAIPVNYATAWAGLIGYGNLQPGERVLVHSAGGGVGIAATQIAKHYGAEVYGTASPVQARALPRGRRRPCRSTTRAPAGRRGSAASTSSSTRSAARASARATTCSRPGGRLVAFGASSVVSGERKNIPAALKAVLRMPRFNLIKQMQDSKAVIGLNMLTLWKDRGTLRPWIEPLTAMLSDGTIDPVIAGAFPFERAGEAQTMIVERRNVGKVVLTP